MAKAKFVKIEIRQKPNTLGITRGGTTEVLLDGKRLKGITSASFNVEAAGLAKVTLTMVGDLSVKGQFNENQYELGNFYPVNLVQNKVKSKKRTSKNG